MKMNYIFMIFGLNFLLLFAGCDKTKNAFEKAKNENTINAYEGFMAEFPETNYVDSALIEVRKLRPVQGVWKGDDIQFNVSSDGKMITVENSTLEESTSMMIVAYTRNFKQTIFLYDSIPINNDGDFKLIIDDPYSQSSNLTIIGNFTSPSEASGKFILSNYGTNKLKGSTEWKATPLELGF
jgi:hypothetical protein